jgi:hypothetical protein
MFVVIVVETTTAESLAACNQASSGLNNWSSGEDRVTLNATGQRWFLSRMDDHCTRQGMKLNITVLPAVMLADPLSSLPPPRILRPEASQWLSRPARWLRLRFCVSHMSNPSLPRTN